MKLRENPTRTAWFEFDGRYRELLYRYARRRGAGHAEAEDIAQEVEMYVFKGMDRFHYEPNKGRFRGYLRASVVHAMARRANGGKKETHVAPEVLESLAESTDASDPLWDREWRLHKLRCAMDSVAAEFEPKTLEAFRLHVLGGMSAPECAEHLGLSQASVYQAKCRVLKRLRETVESADD